MKMLRLLTPALLWSGAIGCLVIAGVYCAFSTFVMPALGRMEPEHAVPAMNAINATILHSLFMPLFFGTTLASLALFLIGLIRWSQLGGRLMAAGGFIYVAGMFLCTVLANVPLNNSLAAAAHANDAVAPVWAAYLKYWTLWNHLRTVSSTAAGVLYMAAIWLR
jgi:uncharacterized membrane protein